MITGRKKNFRRFYDIHYNIIYRVEPSMYNPLK